jgi:hypothetical protein
MLLIGRLHLKVVESNGNVLGEDNLDLMLTCEGSPHQGPTISS